MSSSLTRCGKRVADGFAVFLLIIIINFDIGRFGFINSDVAVQANIKTFLISGYLFKIEVDLILFKLVPLQRKSFLPVE